jgi:hypothetical protein
MQRVEKDAVTVYKDALVDKSIQFLIFKNKSYPQQHSIENIVNNTQGNVSSRHADAKFRLQRGFRRATDERRRRGVRIDCEEIFYTQLKKLGEDW